MQINVGGKACTTALSTLCKYPDSLLAALFSTHRQKLNSDQNGCVFLDRNGMTFTHLLDWLRRYLIPLFLREIFTPMSSGYIPTTLSENERRQLNEELRFWRLPQGEDNISSKRRITQQEAYQFLHRHKGQNDTIILPGADLHDLNLEGAHFGGAWLVSSVFRSANLRYSNLQGSPFIRRMFNNLNV